MFLNKMLICIMILIITSAFVIAQTSPVSEVGKPAPNFTLKDANGKVHNLVDYLGKYVVLEWINFGCPFVIRHYEAHNMQKLQKEYTDKGVVWLSICSSAPGKQGHLYINEIKNNIVDYDAKMSSYLIDEEGITGKMYGARTTPHMFVINPEGKMIYQGAIDDSKSTDKEEVPEKVYVKMALDEAMSGKKVSTPTTQPYGCPVKYKD